MAINVTSVVQTVPATLPRPAAFQDMLDLVAKYVVLTLDNPGTEITFLANIAAPAPKSVATGTIFSQLDAQGRPLRLWTIYLGTWYPFYNGNVYSLTWFVGNWTTYFDSTGLGHFGSPWHGWALANGKNGTQNYNNFAHFIVGGYKADTTGWVANITNPGPANSVSVRTGDLKSGGTIGFVLAAENLPQLTLTLANSVGNIGNKGGGLAAVVAGVSNDQQRITGNFSPPITGTETSTNQAMSILPPYTCAALVQFIGY